MGRTLGINDDYWHFIIPFVIYVVAVPLIFRFIDNVAVGLVLYLVLYLTLGLIQFMYEWIQATDSMVELNYGSFEKFQENSKRDIRFFIMGNFAGTFFGVVIAGVLHVVLGN